jgi:hypothetical protein
MSVSFLCSLSEYFVTLEFGTGWRQWKTCGEFNFCLMCSLTTAKSRKSVKAQKKFTAEHIACFCLSDVNVCLDIYSSVRKFNEAKVKLIWFLTSVNSWRYSKYLGCRGFGSLANSDFKLNFWTYICVKTNKCTNYSFNLLIMYSISYMFRHYITILGERS